MNETNSVVLKAENIHKSFYKPVKTPILRGINLTVTRREAVAIMGRSGEGKSTLLHVLGTLESASEGFVEISGQTVSSGNVYQIRCWRLGFVFQSFHLLEDYTVLENVLMPARIARQNISEGQPAYQRGCELLEKVGLSHRMHFHTKLLSGGEKQRVAIARALCNDPDIILADEPSGNLDKQTSAFIHELLFDFVREKNKSLVVVTHDQGLAALCDRQFYLENGLFSQKEPS